MRALSPTARDEAVAITIYGIECDESRNIIARSRKEGRRKPRWTLALEALGEVLVHKFNRDHSAQARIAGLVDLPMPPAPMGAMIS